MPIDVLLERFLVELMALNAADGLQCDVPGTPQMREIMRRALDAFERAQAAGSALKPLEYVKSECLGDPNIPLAPDRPPVPPFADFSKAPLDTAVLSTVLPLHGLLKLLSEEDRERLEAEWSIRFTSTGTSGGAALLNDFEEKLADRLKAMPESARHFRIAPDESHGRPYVWFTAREDIEHFFGLRAHLRMSKADIARDALGLVHHGPKAYNSDAPNHLVALHFPAAIAEREGHLRPSAVQAFDNRRFVQEFDLAARTTRADWGRTLELYLFRTARGVVPTGCRERLLLRLQASLFEPDERIGFEYLGTVQSVRGDVTNRDCDDSFLRLVARGRNPQDEVEAMCR